MALLYDNIQLRSPSGLVVALIDKQSESWYLRNGLATKVGEKVLELCFEPKNKGRSKDLFYLTPRKNQCVVCGSTEELTRHHVVPRFFRKHFPLRLKASSNHDVLAVCAADHRAYCVFEEEFKAELALEFGLDISGLPLGISENLLKAARILDTCLRGDKKEAARISFARSFSRLCPEVDDHLLEQLAFLISSQRGTNLGKAIVEALGPDNDQALIEFSKRWRRHFVSSMNPNFLPKYWDTEREKP